MKTCLIPFLAVFLVSGSVGLATTIEWGVEFSGATYSDGTPIREEFTFQIGTFSPTFTPSHENLSDWGNHFHTSGVESGSLSWNNLENSVFPTIGEGIRTSTFRTGGDVREGDSVFLWGYNSPDYSGSSEWLLLTNPGWQFPAPTPVGAEGGSLIKFNAVDPGTQMVFGKSFNLAGNADLFDRAWQTQAVPEPATYALLVGLGVAGLVVRRRVRKDASN